MATYPLIRDLRFQTLIPVHEDELDRTFEADWKLDHWSPLKVKPATDSFGPKRTLGDVASFGGVFGPLLLSNKALGVLKDLLEGRGSIFPLACTVGEYFAFRVERRPSTTLGDPVLENEYIFCLSTDKEGVDKIYVNEEFKKRVEQAGLTGFLFDDLDASHVSAPDTLSKELLWETSDQDLYELLYHYALRRMGEENDISRLSIGVQRIYAIQNLEMEVLNGGFHQYFWNTKGEYAPLVLDAYKAIGATKHARIFRDAYQVFKKEEPKIGGYQLLETLEAFSSSSIDDGFGQLEKEFIEMPWEIEDVWRLAVLYIRTRQEDFF